MLVGYNIYDDVIMMSCSPECLCVRVIIDVSWYNIYDVIMMSCSQEDDDEITADDFFTGQGSAIAVHRLIAGIIMHNVYTCFQCM